MTYLGAHLIVLKFPPCRRIISTSTGVWASVWAIQRGGNHKTWGAVGGLRALGASF